MYNSQQSMYIHADASGFNLLFVWGGFCSEASYPTSGLKLVGFFSYNTVTYKHKNIVFGGGGSCSVWRNLS